jgi:hypothetical protein
VPVASTADDDVLAALINEAAADPETAGLILSGSRAVGLETAESDYDLYWVLAGEAYERRQANGASLREKREHADHPPVDLVYVCQRDLDRLPAVPGWATYGYATARVLLDKTGEVTRAIAAIVTMPADKAQADVAGWFDAYANAFYRSVKAWRRGDELGGRLHAADSAGHLVRTLFALEQRWTPYHDRLVPQLWRLDGQGWLPGSLHETLLDLLRTGDPVRQIELEVQVEALLRRRGFGAAVDRWSSELARLRADVGPTVDPPSS